MRRLFLSAAWLIDFYCAAYAATIKIKKNDKNGRVFFRGHGGFSFRFCLENERRAREKRNPTMDSEGGRRANKVWIFRQLLRQNDGDARSISPGQRKIPHFDGNILKNSSRSIGFLFFFIFLLCADLDRP